jgi:fructose-1,6-bisphosphatase/inositol monophosphatase family enzyme
MTDHTQLDIELDTAIDVARRAAVRAMSITRQSPIGEVRTKKHHADLVTAVDTAVERAVRELITAELPEHRIVGEEYGGTAGDGPTWYCDPVDGTTNLTAGLPWTSFSLSLAIGRRPLVGVVADPWRDEIWQAAAGRGVLVNGEPHLPVSSSPRSNSDSSLTGTVIGTEWASFRPWPGMELLLASLAERHCTTRVMGSSTLTIAQVAVGRTVGAVIGSFQPEDHLAGTLLCQEAGMAVLDESGRQNPFPDSGGILVARPDVADELYDLWAAARLATD